MYALVFHCYTLPPPKKKNMTPGFLHPEIQVVSGERHNTLHFHVNSHEQFTSSHLPQLMLSLEPTERTLQIKKHRIQSSLKSLWGILLWNNPFIYSTNTNTQDSLCLYRYSSKPLMGHKWGIFWFVHKQQMEEMTYHKTDHVQHKTAFLDCFWMGVVTFLTCKS